MSTVKISELALITQLNANTSNTLFLAVDIPTGVTGKFTGHTLAQGLYSNEVLNVGNNQTLLPNTVAQFSLDGQSYIQTNLVNTNDGGSADIVVTANTGTDSTYFIDMGYVNKDYESGSEFNNIGTAVNRLDGYIYAQGSTGNTWGGNLIVGSTTTGKEIRFIAGGGSKENVVARMNSTAIILNQGLVFADGSVQNTSLGSTGSYANAAFIQANAAFISANTPKPISNSAALYANAAFIQANAAFLTANTPPAIANSAALYANGAFTQANAAFTKANNALANTSGTFGGAMYITGNLSVNGTFLLANSNFSATESAVTISATTTTATPSNDGYMIHISGKNGAPTRLVSDAYGTGAYSLFAGRAARGTVESPTALQSGDVIARFSGNGYGTTKYQTLGVGRIDFVAAQNFTDANTGSQIQFWNCSVGSNTLTNIATFNGDSATFTGYIEPQKGFVYTPTVYPGAQTAITINMSTNSVVRAQTAAGLVVTLSNLLAGKEVVVWITNTAGTNQTFTHGVSALNSSVNATTYSIPGTSTIMARYMSMDGTTQNTFVAVTHA